ncbi:MAG: spondin domain-containing protein [Pseudomonadota bacterium]
MHKNLIAVGTLALSAAATSIAHADSFEVSITNISRGVQFTPILVVAHSADIALWEFGAPASDELAFLAEDGDTTPLQTLLATVPDLVSDFGATEGLTDPGSSASVIVEGGEGFDRISLAAMLLPTNDSFVGADSLRVPRRVGGTRTYFAIGLDAGSELNDEVCENIPGPTCGGAGASPNEGGEGYVHVSGGIAGIADVTPSVYDWRNPVARVTITRLD